MHHNDIDAILILCELNVDDQVRREGAAMGFKKGKLSTLSGLIKNGLLSLTKAAEQAHMSVSEFQSKAGLQ